MEKFKNEKEINYIKQVNRVEEYLSKKYSGLIPTNALSKEGICGDRRIMGIANNLNIKRIQKPINSKEKCFTLRDAARIIVNIDTIW